MHVFLVEGEKVLHLHFKRRPCWNNPKNKMKVWRTCCVSKQGLKFYWDECESLRDQLPCPGSDLVASKWEWSCLAGLDLPLHPFAGSWSTAQSFCFFLCLKLNGTLRFNKKSSWEEMQTCKSSLGWRVAKRNLLSISPSGTTYKVCPSERHCRKSQMGQSQVLKD